MPCERLTCLVPTHNRPHFLRRLLKFYSQFPPGFRFLVVDSSNSLAAAENREVIERVRGVLDIDYQHVALSILDKCVQGLEQIQSPFVVLCADDDFLFSDAVWRCVEVLRSEPGVASAMGRTAMINANHPRRWSVVLKGYSIEDDRPLDRCRRMAREWFSNFYAVHRTETLLDNFRVAVANTDFQQSTQLSETLLTQLSVLRGQVKVLPLMYSLREQHRANTGTARRNLRLPHAEMHYQRFRRGLIEQFERAGVDRADVERFIEDSYGQCRDPDPAKWRRRRSSVEVIRKLSRAITDRVADTIWTGCTRHRRLVRASDFAGCESMWHAASELIRAFPDGIATEPSSFNTVGDDALRTRSRAAMAWRCAAETGIGL